CSLPSSWMPGGGAPPVIAQTRAYPFRQFATSTDAQYSPSGAGPAATTAASSRSGSHNAAAGARAEDLAGVSRVPAGVSAGAAGLWTNAAGLRSVPTGVEPIARTAMYPIAVPTSSATRMSRFIPHLPLSDAHSVGSRHHRGVPAWLRFGNER